MPPNTKTRHPSAAGKDLYDLIDLTKTTQTLLQHFLSSLAPTASQSTASSPSTSPTDPNPLDILKATTTLLKSHTTTLSLLLLTPPLSPPALSKKIGDVSSSVLSAMVSAAATPSPALGSIMAGELRACVRRVLQGWGEVLGCVLKVCEGRIGKSKDGDKGVSEAERNDILAATGVVWEACDALVKVCEQGVAGVVVRKAEEWRGQLIDAIGELKEWGEDVDEDEEDGVTGSGDEDEDDIFGAANKLGKGDEELKALLNTSVKKLKTVGVLYQALVKRRLKSFLPLLASQAKSTTNGDAPSVEVDNMTRLDTLMATLKSIPESVDDLASAFYDLDGDEAKKLLDKCCGGAKSAAELMERSWEGKEDEFTAWSAKWKDALGVP